MLPSINLLHFYNLPILEQLQIEEALLRADAGNYFLINEGSPDSVVMGISAKTEEVVQEKALEQANIPLIRRFSGGGTVFVDSNTLFMTFICNHSTFDIKAYPEQIMRWSGEFYEGALELPEFRLRENDYVIEDKKCGGNAQYFRKDRWLHHSSFLWDFDKEKMNFLKHPPKMPEYRSERTHNDFLCKLHAQFKTKKILVERVVKHLEEYFVVNQGMINLEEILSRPHRKATKVLNACDFCRS